MLSLADKTGYDVTLFWFKELLIGLLHIVAFFKCSVRETKRNSKRESGGVKSPTQTSLVFITYTLRQLLRQLLTNVKDKDAAKNRQGAGERLAETT